MWTSVAGNMDLIALPSDDQPMPVGLDPGQSTIWEVG
jgi:hypothetical protein